MSEHRNETALPLRKGDKMSPSTLPSDLRKQAGRLREGLPMRPLVYATATMMEEAADRIEQLEGGRV